MRRIILGLAAVLMMGLGFAVAPQPAQAAACPQPPTAIVIWQGRTYPMPIDNPGPPYDFVADVPDGGGLVTFGLGGAWLRPNEEPFWTVTDVNTGRFVGVLISTRTNNNCISNERSHSVFGLPGTSYLFTVTAAGNGGVIRNVPHFRIHFV